MFCAPSLRHALQVEAVPARHELPVDDGSRYPMFGPVFARGERVDGVRPQRMLHRRARGPGSEGLVDLRRMERKALADPAVVHRDPGVLAHEVLLGVGNVDIPLDRLEDALARDRRSRPARRSARREVLRDVLERPHVQVGGDVLDGAAQGPSRPRSCSLPRRGAPGTTAEDDALEQRVAHHAVATVGAARDLTARVEALERRLGVRVDHETAVLVMEDG